MSAEQTAALRDDLEVRPVQALNHLADLVTSFAVTQTFAAAVKLGVFEDLARGPATAEEIAARVKIHPQGCRRLLSALRNLGLVESADGHYWNSSVGNYCCSQASVNLGTIIGGTEPFYHMFAYLPDALREYSPRWQQALGTSQADNFGALYEDPVRIRQFAALMQSLSVPQGQVIADHFDFAPYHCILDVAGGPGGQAIEIGRKHAHLYGIIMDMPPICEIATENIMSARLSSRFKAVPGDLFEGGFPKGADVVLLGHLLHDWSDESCHKILQHAAEALPSGGALLISESVLAPDYSASRWALMKDITMLVACESGARERTEAEYRDLINAHGFEFLQTVHLDAPRDLIVSRKK
jgi:3-hydroxy-5-methyl-1-naphthoate 3-O-methyltransferase